MDRARKAKMVLKAVLGNPEWLVGIGIGVGPSVKVNVSSLTDEVQQKIPLQVDGIPVVVEEVGKIRPKTDPSRA